MKEDTVSPNNTGDVPKNVCASNKDINTDDMSVKNEKSTETSPAVSRYGRTHKPKITDDFLPTDKKVGAILGISPKKQANQTLDTPHSVCTSLERTVEKGRLVSELLGNDVKKKSKRGRKPKNQLISSANSNKVSQEGNSLGLVQPSVTVIKSEASTSDKAENICKIEIKDQEEDEEGKEEALPCNIKTEKENEIMSPDVTSSVDDNSLPKSEWDQTVLSSVKDCGWNPGDLAWARVGGHPFWPCMVAIDPLTKVFTKIKRVGRGLTTVQRSLHVQFFGDNGRHSWVSTTCVIRFEGKDCLQNFADKVLTEMRKKDKKFSSAFIIRPSSKYQWDVAVREAEEALPKTNQERIKFFEDQFPPENYVREFNSKKMEEEARKASHSSKRKRSDNDKDEKPVKQVKIEASETDVEKQKEKVSENNDSVVSRKKRGRSKRGGKELSDYRLFAEKYSKHASEIHPGITEEKLEKLMLRMWSAMDEQEKSMYHVETGLRSIESSSDEEVDSNDNDNDNSSLSTRESSPWPSSQTFKKSGGIFRGTRQEKVCQICLKPGNTVKCKGFCNGIFHIECNRNPAAVKQEDAEAEQKRRKGRAPKVPKIDSGLVNGKSSKDSTEEDSIEATSNSETEKEEVVSDKEEAKRSKNSEVDNDSGEFRCRDCSENRIPCCFLCNKEEDPKTNSDIRFKCVNGHCGKYYHLECVKEWPQASCVDGPVKKQGSSNKVLTTSESSRNQVLTCPQHVCHTCASDDPRNASARFNYERLVRCILCPTAYHTGNYCVPAGSEILTGSQIICPRHYEPPIKGSHHVNASWCFICAMVGGSLICCDLCPTSFHAECLRIAPPEGGYICEDCDTGRYPLYGEVVWVKLGSYRWWPAQILFPFQVPDNIANISHKLGEFAVKFFGSHDHYWVNRGRVFLYQEGDTGHKSAKRTSVDGLFLKALDEAKEAHAKIRVERSQRELEARPGMKPPSYTRIKANKPVGNVRVYEVDPSGMTPCDCDPNSANPCGPDSDCLNRILMVECTPGVCAAGERCGNQCFVKREYPPLEPFKTESRGWGLRALRSLKKGDFVIEYVGEMIDEAEYRRRLECKHKDKDENYYFLTIDNQRMLDAGPKGNVARFMNHCCLPNCETQKWTVNGDTRVGLFALKDIPFGQELTFNYNLECVGTDKKPCMCGAPNCSGFIGSKVTKPVEDDRKTKLSKQEQQRALKRKKKRQSVKSADAECFECGNGGELILCDNKTCPKGYHLSCAKRKSWPKGFWLCPWHFCDICKRRTGKRCGFCPSSFCIQHAEGNIRMNSTLGMVCLKHDEDIVKSDVKSEISEAANSTPKGRDENNHSGNCAEESESKTKLINNSSLTDNEHESTQDSADKSQISLGNTLAAIDSMPRSLVNPTKSNEAKESQNDQKVRLLNNSTNTPSPKKRGRPRKYALLEPSPTVGSNLVSPLKTDIVKNEIKTPEFQPQTENVVKNEIKTPEFQPQTENVSTVKKKRGRPRKYPLVISPSDDMKTTAAATSVPNEGKMTVSPIKLENHRDEPSASQPLPHNSVSPVKKRSDTNVARQNEGSVQAEKVNAKTKTEDTPASSRGIKNSSQSAKEVAQIKVAECHEKEPENNLEKETKMEGSTLVTPRISSRKRHLSEKLTAFLTKSAKKHGLKSFIDLQAEDSGKNTNEIDDNVGKSSLIKGNKSPEVWHKVNKTEKIVSPKSRKVNMNKKPHSYKSIDSYMTILPKFPSTNEQNTVSDNGPPTSSSSKAKSAPKKSKLTNSSTKGGKSSSTKATSPQETKASKISKEKPETSKVLKQSLTKSECNEIKVNKTEETYKSEKSSYSFFKSFQKKSTILQRVNHKPELGKSTFGVNQKFTSTSPVSNSVLKGSYGFSVPEKVSGDADSKNINSDKNSTLYHGSQLNGVGSSSLLESFSDSESQFLEENVSTIPIKFSEFEQSKDEFHTQLTSEEVIDTQQQTNAEFSASDGEETQKLSEDGKYQILTNMRPESLDFDKQGPVAMPVGS